MQRTTVGSHAPLIRRLVNSLEPAGPELRIADFGCGPGQSAIEAAPPAIEAWRAGGNARAYSGAFRACGLSSLRSYLLARFANTAEHEEDLEREFFRRFEELYRREPGRHAFEVFPLRIILRRR